jgi:hypothetical protein
MNPFFQELNDQSNGALTLTALKSARVPKVNGSHAHRNKTLPFTLGDNSVVLGKINLHHHGAITFVWHRLVCPLTFLTRLTMADSISIHGGHAEAVQLCVSSFCAQAPDLLLPIAPHLE